MQCRWTNKKLTAQSSEQAIFQPAALPGQTDITNSSIRRNLQEKSPCLGRSPVWPSESVEAAATKIQGAAGKDQPCEQSKRDFSVLVMCCGQKKKRGGRLKTLATITAVKKSLSQMPRHVSSCENSHLNKQLCNRRLNAHARKLHTLMTSMKSCVVG